MQHKFRSLIAALSRAAKATPQNVLEAISTLPPVGTLPSPWTTWLYLTLMAWRKRQQWGKDLLRKHLPKAIPPCRKFRKSEQPVELISDRWPDGGGSRVTYLYRESRSLWRAEVAVGTYGTIVGVAL